MQTPSRRHRPLPFGSVLDVFFHVTVFLLGRTLGLLDEALGLLLLAADQLAGGFLHFACGVLGSAFDLILVHADS